MSELEQVLYEMLDQRRDSLCVSRRILDFVEQLRRDPLPDWLPEVVEKAMEYRGIPGDVRVVEDDVLETEMVGYDDWAEAYICADTLIFAYNNKIYSLGIWNGTIYCEAISIQELARLYQQCKNSGNEDSNECYRLYDKLCKLL